MLSVPLAQSAYFPMSFGLLRWEVAGERLAEPLLLMR